MMDVGRPARREPALRRGHAISALACCCRLLNAMLDERYPARFADPSAIGDLGVRVGEYFEAFFDEAAFLFDIAACRGLPEEPARTVQDAFAVLMDSETVHNVKGGHVPWPEWYTGHIGDDIIQLFDESHARAVNPGNDTTIADLFSRAYRFLRRITMIAQDQEETVSTYILDIMPDAVRFSLESVVDYEKMAFNKPWMSIVERYAVYRHKLAKELGVTERTLANYERTGKTPKSGYWPTPLNPDDGPGKKYYDPMHTLKALSALPKDFSKATRVDDIIGKLMSNKLASKIAPKPVKVEPEEKETE